MVSMLLGGMMCPVAMGGGSWCPFMYGSNFDVVLCFGIKIFLLVWVIFVPIVITARLEKIIKLLSEKK